MDWLLAGLPKQSMVSILKMQNRCMERVMLGQYIVSASSAPAQNNFRTVDLDNGLFLQYNEDLDLISRHSNSIHVKILGQTLDIENNELPMTDENFEDYIYAFAGRFIAIVNLFDEVRVYLDPGGFLPFVYSSAHRIGASGPGLIRALPYDEDRKQTVERCEWLPFGLTAKKDVRRLLPNHYLDLKTWSAHRHWSVPEEVETRSFDENIEIIAGTVSRTIDAAAARWPLVLPLTGGYDSRMLLSCALAQRDRLLCYTTGGGAGSWDAQSAAKIAGTMGIEHLIVQRTDATPAERADWREKTGYSVAGSASRTSRSAWTHLDGKASLVGFAGEVGRCYYGYGYNEQRPLTGEALLQVLNITPFQDAVAAANAWLAPFSRSNHRRVFDAAYIEQRLGCWAGPQSAGGQRALASIVPMNHRSVYQAMLDVQPGLRHRNAIHAAIVARRTPELARIPYRPPEPFKAKARRVVTAAKRGLRDLVQLSGR
jgi:hypothetical protein